MTELRPKSVPEQDPNTKLTLSAEPALHTEDDRSPAEAIERELERIEIAQRAGADSVALRHIDHLIDYVWGPVPDGAA